MTGTYPGAIDGGLVDASRLGNLVGSSVGLESTVVLSVGARVVRAERLNDIVLYEGVASPAVDSEVAVTLRAERATIVDGAGVRN